MTVSMAMPIQSGTRSLRVNCDPAASVSTTAASLETDRAEHRATMLNHGEVLITGGVQGYKELCWRPKPHVINLANAELYQ
jgi:hypothetical protein